MNYLEYMPLAQNRAGQLGSLTGQPFAQWATGKNFTDCWGDPKDWANTQQLEVYGVADLGGEQWLTLTRLGPHKIDTVRCLIHEGGTARDLPCPHGHPYAPINFRPCGVEVWGKVGGMHFYWMATYRRLLQAFNPVLSEWRECIRQSEVWGNPVDHRPGAPWQWTRGGPQPVDAVPFNLAGAPVPIKTESAWFQCIGKAYGPGWTMGEIKDGADVVTSCATSHGWGW